MSFICRSGEFFTNVEITFDKFHLMKLGSEAVDENMDSRTKIRA
ncbi:hypothetical protein DI243_01110 [Paenibacillus polymyxa]|nr:hypothetical protein DI243_01110 [Paenibacillus polymyxa]